MLDRLNVLIQSSDYYAPSAGVMLTSLFENNQDIDDITIYLMTSDMSKKNKERFEVLAERFHREIKFFDVTRIDTFLESNHMPKWNGSYATYYKIFALSTIKEKMERLVYLDVDMVIVGSLLKLVDFDLEDNLLGMCLDFAPTRYTERIILNSSLYYNAGLIVFDVQKWNEYKATDKIINHLTTVHVAYPIADQDLLNIVFQRKIKTIPLKYNCNIPIYIFNDYILIKKAYGISTDFYSEEEVMSVKLEPAIIHCGGFCGLRPWNKEFGGLEHPNKKVWEKYKKISPWSDFTPLKCKMSFANIAQMILYRILPKKIFAIVQGKSLIIYLFLKAQKYGIQIKKSIAQEEKKK